MRATRTCSRKHGVPFWPDAAWRDAVACAIVVFAIVALAAIFGPPKLGAPPDPSMLAKDPAPDWYLLWYYGAFALIPRGLTNPFIILAPALGLGSLFVVPLFNKRRAPSVAASVGGRRRDHHRDDDPARCGLRPSARHGRRILLRRFCPRM